MSWRRCTKGNPCPICGKPDWCSTTEDGAARCMRVGDAPHGWEVNSRQGDGGTVFRPEGEKQERSTYVPRKPRRKPVVLQDWSHIQGTLWTAVDYKKKEVLAENLGVRTIDLSVIGLGWHEKSESWSFPMYNPEFTVVGIRLRKDDGSKFSITGSRQGVFGIPNPMDTRLGRPVLIAEGPTDTASLIRLGYTGTLGRPSCRGAKDILKTMLKGHDVVIVSDSDAPGEAGADDLASHLEGVAERVRIIQPPAKDIREWVNAGATQEQIDSLIESAKDCGHAPQVQGEPT